MNPKILVLLVSMLLFGCISNPKPSALNGGVFLTIETKSNRQSNLNTNNLYFQKIADNQIITIEDIQIKNKFKIEFEKQGYKFDSDFNFGSLIVAVNKKRISVPFNRNNGNTIISNGVGYNISIYKVYDKNLLEIFTGTASVISMKGDIETKFENKLIENLVSKYNAPDFSVKKWIYDEKEID